MLGVTYKPFMLSVIILNVVVLSVVAPTKTNQNNDNFFFKESLKKVFYVTTQKS
jgi:hypothetical protein